MTGALDKCGKHKMVGIDLEKVEAKLTEFSAESILFRDRNQLLCLLFCFFHLKTETNQIGCAESAAE